MIPSIYINIEDDVSQIVSRLKRERSPEIILVCPKRCFLFSDSINLRLLKKQLDLLKKHVYILTMDERGQVFAKEAGFELRFLPNTSSKAVQDIRIKKQEEVKVEKEINPIKKIVQLFEDSEEELPLKTAEVQNLKQVSPQTQPRVLVVDRVFPKAQEQKIQEQKENKVHKTKFGAKFVLLFFLSTIIFFAVVVFYILPSATVSIFAKTENISRDLEVSLSTSAQKSDPARLLLPATRISQTLEAENTFQSMGKKEVGNKARGTVRIYNFTGLPINLKAQTTTFSVGSKSYILTADALAIKPTLFKNAKTKEIDPESLSPEVEIEAVEGGESYNLPEGVRIEISNKVFGSKPKLLYSKSETAIGGATTRFLSVVSEDDIQKSKTNLTEQIVQEVKTELSKKELVFPEKGFVVEIVSFTTDKQSGAQSPNFTGKLRATITGLAFNEQELNKMIVERLMQAIGADKTFKDIMGGNKLIYALKNSYDLGSEAVSLSVHFESNLAYRVETNGLAESLKGKKPEEVQALLKTHPEIDRIDINLSPAWQKTFPNFVQKIRLEVN